MVESSNTQASPISGQPSPREVVAAYLRLTVDTPDLQKARLHLTKRSTEEGDFNVRAMPAGSSYTMGAEEADGLGRRIPVSLKRPTADGGAEEEMTVPMIVVEEEGQWKIDLPATMERLMGGMGEVMDKVAGAAGEALTGALGGVEKALAEGMGGMMVPEAKGAAARAVKAAKAVTKAVTKAVQKAVKKVVRKVAKKAAKAAAPKSKKAAAKKATKKPAKKAARKPAKKAAKKSARKRRR